MEKLMRPRRPQGLFVLSGLLLLFVVGAGFAAEAGVTPFDSLIMQESQSLIGEGKQTFRFDTFGDEAFWGGTLQLHKAILGEKLGGVGPGVSPATAISVGLKVDVEALTNDQVQAIRTNQLNLQDPAVTLALLKQRAVVGLTGLFNSNGALQSVGIQCALCHSTVDNSLAFGIGHRLDGWANHDLNVGAIIALAPNLQPVADLLGTDVPSVRTVLNSWGPGKFDAELFLDGKAFNPQQVTDGVVTGRDVPGATLIPNAFDLAGYNQHTWTGAWGTVSYWNAFVAVLEMHGVGSFFDPRLDNAAKYPIAAANGFGHIQVDPGSDRVTPKLAGLQVYQLSLPAPRPRAGVDYNAAAAQRGHALFNGKARCGTCHVEPLWTEPGWNLHPAGDIGIDAFQAERAPDNVYKTMNLAGLYIRERGLFMNPANKGRFYHDGRFLTLLDVVRHYNRHFQLGLNGQEVQDLVEYLKSL